MKGGWLKISAPAFLLEILLWKPGSQSYKQFFYFFPQIPLPSEYYCLESRKKTLT